MREKDLENCVGLPEQTKSDLVPQHPANGAAYAYGSFCKYVLYGWSAWPSYSYWIIPGTITDAERAR